MNLRPVFMTGIARGGTSLVGRMVDAHPRSAIAIDAYLHIFRALRNSIVIAEEPGFDPARPMEDFYFDPLQRRRLDVLLAGSIDVPLSGVDASSLREAIRRRSGDESGDLVPYVDDIDGTTPRGLIDSALAQIARARPADDLAAVGVKDLWFADLIPALARGYPDARFVLIFRDPRDVVASAVGFLPIDPTQVGHVLSMLRHWRKSVALAQRYARDPALAGRFLTVRYEDVVRDPKFAARRLGDFIGVGADPAMVEVSGFRDYNSGKFWKGNSTFDKQLGTISSTPVGRWREHLDPAATALVELVCGAEMRACGYPSSDADDGDAGMLAFLETDGSRTCSWRSDSGTPDTALSLERARRALLDAMARPRVDDIRDAFLFEEIYDALRANAAIVPVGEAA